jgi:hypothetical protein
MINRHSANPPSLNHDENFFTRNPEFTEYVLSHRFIGNEFIELPAKVPKEYRDYYPSGFNLFPGETNSTKPNTNVNDEITTYSNRILKKLGLLRVARRDILDRIRMVGYRVARLDTEEGLIKLSKALFESPDYGKRYTLHSIKFVINQEDKYVYKDGDEFTILDHPRRASANSGNMKRSRNRANGNRTNGKRQRKNNASQRRNNGSQSGLQRTSRINRPASKSVQNILSAMQEYKD